MTHTMKEGAEKIIYNNNNNSNNTLKYFFCVFPHCACLAIHISFLLTWKTWKQITFKLGNFLNLKALLFPEESMNSSKLVHKKKIGKKPWKGLLSVSEPTNIYALYEPPTPTPAWNPRETA